MRLTNFKWYRRLLGGSWYKHVFTEDACEVTFDPGTTFWARYGTINRYSDVVGKEDYIIKEDKIKFGPEYGINPPEIGIEEFMYFPTYIANVSLRGMFLIKYRHIESDRVTKVTISPQSLVASGALDLDKLKEFLK